MATRIVPLSIAPAFTPADAARAARYRGYSCEGRWSDPDALMFYFRLEDGSDDHFTAAQLRVATWWHAMPFEVALSVEANLYPVVYAEARFRYVARSDKRAGGMLAAGSRLSDYFDGETRDLEARHALDEARATYPDAAIFHTDDIDDAERLLVDPRESSLLSQERAAVARFARATAAGAGAHA